jgi:multisubunit Na+/H+ antiporter MnhC subunit
LVIEVVLRGGLLLEGVQPLEEDLAERLTEVVAGIDIVLLAIELHVFFTSQILASVAVVTEGVIEVIAEHADPVPLAFVLLPESPLVVFQ